MKPFKPMLSYGGVSASDEVLALVEFPKFCSVKLDGIRCVFKDGQMLSRSLKEIRSVHLQEKFTALKKYSRKTGLILDGELYDPTMTFQDITSWCMTIDRSIAKKVKRFGEYTGVPETLKFYCFDVLDLNRLEQPFERRYHEHVIKLAALHSEIVHALTQHVVKNEADVVGMFDMAIDEGFEGLILKDPKSVYKFGRTTKRENTMFKVKPFKSFDAKIIDVIERMENTSESYVNELGQKQKHQYKDDMKPTGIAAAFVVTYDNNELKVTLTGSEEWRTEVWNNRDQYIGKTVEYKAMMHGAKDVPRHPVFVRMRDDKD